MPQAAAAYGTAFILLLAALTSLGQFGSNVFLPGLPALARDLDCSPSSAAWSYSLYLAAFGVMQLIAGALGDRFGRRRTAVLSAAMSLRQSHASQTAALPGFIQMASSTIGTMLGNDGIDAAPTVGMQLVMTTSTLLALVAVLCKAAAPG